MESIDIEQMLDLKNTQEKSRKQGKQGKRRRKRDDKGREGD